MQFKGENSADGLSQCFLTLSFKQGFQITAALTVSLYSSCDVLQSKPGISCMLANLLMNSLVVVFLADYSVEWTEEKSITTT